MYVTETPTGPDSMAHRIKRLREQRGLSQHALADAAGVRGHTVYRYEAGHFEPSGQVLDRIAEALGVTSRWLLRGDEPEPETTERDQRRHPALEEMLSTTFGQMLPPEVVEELTGIAWHKFEPTPETYLQLAMTALARSRGKDTRGPVVTTHEDPTDGGKYTRFQPGKRKR